AHLLRLAGGRLSSVGPFEQAEGRDAWYTPWGDPADVRSIAAGPREAATYVNIHVGGVLRSPDGERGWTPTLDIEVDVHQVIAHPTRPQVVLVAAAVGLGVSRDQGESWEFVTAGLHARYARAVAVAGDWVLMTASTGPGGRRSAIYRRRLDGGDDFERCRAGLPEWFSHNIDTACLATVGPVAAFGTEDGRVFRSLDAGASWELAAKGLPEIRCLALG
ncbi:MAG: WD40/YVTN/BNR-like repeat-containing protein, partial [Candidatus Rokuibacteriota bacterium]